MKRQLKIYFTCLIILGGFAMNLMAQSANGSKPWSKEDTENWFNSKLWLNGLTALPLQGIDKMEFSRQYHGNKELWDKAFSFFSAHNLNALAPGKYPIDGENVFATVSEYAPADNSKWESHRKYIDIQYVVSGKETMGKVSLSEATVLQEYNEAKDVAFYDTKVGNFFVVGPHSFLIFFPSDVHRPGLKTEGADKVKKIVIKVKAVESK